MFLTLTLYLFTSNITSVYAQELENIPQAPGYSATSVAVIDATTGIVLYSSNGDAIKYPASITKIMTALVVLEQVGDLTERIQFSDRAIFTTPRTSSHIAMDVGETLTVYEALYAIMLPSANEVSLALAEHVAGTIEDFVELMNRRAHSLGAYDTHFVNPSGLHATGHVTTAYDIAIIMREAVRNPAFVNIMSTLRFDIPPTERQPLVRHLLNTNRLIQSGPLFNDDVIGSKTGFTTPAGHTLVTYAQRGDRRLIVSVLGGTNPGKFTDTTALLDFGFALQYEPVQIFEAAANTPTVPLYQRVDGTRTGVGRVTLRANNDLYFDLPPGFDTSQLRYVLHVPQALEAPVNEGSIHGRMTIYVDDFRIGDISLAAVETVPVYTPDPPPAVEESPAPTVAIEYAPVYHAQFHTEPAPAPFWSNELLLTMAIPLAVSVLTLVGSLVVYAARRKRRAKKILHERYARYPHYRYR